MGLFTAHLKRILERAPAPTPWCPALDGEPPPRLPMIPRPAIDYPNLLPPVPWLARGDNALLCLGAIIFAGGLALFALASF